MFDLLEKICPGTAIIDNYDYPDMLGVVEFVNKDLDLVEINWQYTGRWRYTLSALIFYIHDGTWLLIDDWTKELKVPSKEKAEASPT